MELRSPAFENEARIPKQYTRDGQETSPPLEWHDVPDGTESFALICEDPDAPKEEPFVHWVVGNIPGKVREAREGESPGVEGMNDFGLTGYGGPMPPEGHGPHHYHFRLYALDTVFDYGKGVTKNSLQADIEDHIIAQAELTGIYER